MLETVSRVKVVGTIPEVVSRCDWVVQINVQTGEAVLWITQRIIFIQVTVPLNENANRAALMDTKGKY